MPQYQLIVKNNSSLEGDICVYQANPDLKDSNVMSLAWFTEHVHPTTNAKFEWSADYCFVWHETGSLAPAITCEASQVWPAEPSGKNGVTLTYKNGAFTFENLQEENQEGCLSVTQDTTIPLKTASVGIGMSGSGTFVVQASPNMNLMFTPHPAYWITFGEYQQGQVLNTTEITNSIQIEFPPNVFMMEATLNPDNTWSVTPAQR